MNSIPFKKKKKKKCKKEKIERQHSVRLSRISISEATRSAHRSSRARAPFHFFLSSGLFIPFFSLSLSPLPPPFIHFSFHAIHPFRFFAFPFSLFPSACSFSIRAVGFYIFRFVSRIISSEDLPAPPRVLQKKGRGARREERNVGLRDRDRHVSATRPRSEKLFSQCKGMDRARRQHRRGP